MSRPVLFAIIAILILIASLAGWLLSEADDAILDGPAIAEQGERRRREAERHAIAPAPDAPPRAQSGMSGIPETRPLVPAEAGPGEGASEKVHVVGVDGRNPGEGYTLSVVDMAAIDVAAREAAGDLIGFLKGHGDHYPIPGNGALRISRPDSRVLIGAFNDEHFAYTMWRPGQRKLIELELKTVSSITVRIRDQKGRPVAGSAAVLGRARGTHGSERIFAVKKADESGAARLHLLDQVVAASSRELPLFAGVRGLLQPPVRQEFDPHRPPQHELELLVPECGAMEVRFVDADGKPMTEPLSLTATIVAPGSDATSDRQVSQRNRGYSEVVSQGRTRIPLVTCGLELILRAEGRSGSSYKPVQMRCLGPQTPDENCVVTLRFDRKWPVLRARLLNDNGKAIKKKAVSARLSFIRDDSSSNNSLRGQTNDEGVIELPLKENVTAELDTIVARFSVSGESEVATRVAEKSIPLDALLLDKIDAGDLVVEELPVLVSGVVVDAGNNPVAGAWIDLSSKSDDWGTRQRFHARTDMGRRTDEGGRFQVRGTVDESEFNLQVSAEGFLAQSVPVVRGAESLRVSLVKGGFVTGTVVLPESMAMRDITIEFSRSDRDAKPSIRTDKKGSFKSEALEPGRYDLEVYLRARHRKPIKVLNNLEVLGGQTRDVGAVVVDLQGIKLDLVLARPADLPRKRIVRVSAMRPGTDEVLATTIMLRHRRSLFVPEKSCDLVCTLEGHRELRLNNVGAGEVELSFRRGIPIRFEVTNLAILPEDSLVRTTAYPDNGRRVSRLLGGTEGTKSLGAPGSYRISTLIGVKSEGGRRYTQVKVDPEIINVEESDKEQVFEITLDADSVKAALDSLND